MHMSRYRIVLVWCLALSSAAAFLLGGRVTPVARLMAQELGVPQGRGGGQRGGGAPTGGGGGGGAAAGIVVVKQYADVVTANAKTMTGIFKVHRITEGNRDQLLFEIPK